MTVIFNWLRRPLKNHTLQQASLVCMLLTLLTACGFQLRGSYEIPVHLKNICLTQSGEVSLSKELRSRLILSDVNLVNEGSQCSTLKIINDGLERRTLSLFPNGQVAEYELIYQVNYQVMVKGGDTHDYQVEILRDYQDDPDRVLAKSREMKLILKEMRVEAADRITRQLSSIRF